MLRVPLLPFPQEKEQLCPELLRLQGKQDFNVGDSDQQLAHRLGSRISKSVNNNHAQGAAQNGMSSSPSTPFCADQRYLGRSGSADLVRRLISSLNVSILPRCPQ
jgi:hypothetical protein